MNLAAKIALLAGFVLRPCHWDAQAAAWSRLIPLDAPESRSGGFAAAVAEGRVQSFELVGPGGRSGLLLGRVDRSYQVPEFVIEAAYSKETRLDLTADFLPEIEAIALSHGCGTIRFHTMRPGLLRKALTCGFRMVEVIARKDLRHA